MQLTSCSTDIYWSKDLLYERMHYIFIYNLVIHPYICFGLSQAILRESKYFNIDYTSVLKSWYIHFKSSK